MGFILYENEIENATALTTTGITSSSELNLLRPQLQPQANVSAEEAVITVELGSAQQIDGIGIFRLRSVTNLVTLDGGTRDVIEPWVPSILIEFYYSGVWNTLSHDDYELHWSEFDSAGGISVVMRYTGTPQSVEDVRITLSGNPFVGGESRSIGALFIGKFIDGPGITQKAASVGFKSSSELQDSDGGQLYASRGVGYRVVDFKQNVITPADFAGGLQSPKEIELSMDAATLSGITDNGDDSATNTTAGSSGTITFSNILAADSLYEVRAKVTPDSAGAGSVASNVGEARPGSFATIGVASGTDLVFTLSPDTGQKYTISGLKLFEDRGGQAKPDRTIGNATARDERQGMLAVMADANKGNPIVVVPNAGSYDGNCHFYYGYVERWAPYREGEGDLRSGGFTLRETL